MSRYILLIGLVAVAVTGGYFLGRHSQPVVQREEPAASAPQDNTAAPDTVNGSAGFNPDFVKTAAAVAQTVADSIPVTGKLSLDKQRIHIAAARVAGRLGKVYAADGQAVVAGQTLAELYSPDFISAQQELLLAKRFRDALGHGDLEPTLASDAEATYRSAASRIKVLGASDQDLQRLEQSGVIEEYLKIRAPISGVVVQRNVDSGGYLNVGDPLMSLADVDTLWLVANTYVSDYAALKLGQKLDFQTDALPGRSFSGTVTFIAPSLDPVTHTLAIRCEVPNRGMLLRPELFVSGHLEIGVRSAWVVPQQAVVHIRDLDYVFVRDAAKNFRRVQIKGHAIDEGRYAVVDGLSGAAEVVTDGGVLLNQMLSTN